jgi:hypothetical protein
MVAVQASRGLLGGADVVPDLHMHEPEAVYRNLVNDTEVSDG